MATTALRMQNEVIQELTVKADEWMKAFPGQPHSPGRYGYRIWNGRSEEHHRQDQARRLLLIV